MFTKNWSYLIKVFSSKEGKKWSEQDFCWVSLNIIEEGLGKSRDLQKQVHCNQVLSWSLFVPPCLGLQIIWLFAELSRWMRRFLCSKVRCWKVEEWAAEEKKWNRWVSTSSGGILYARGLSCPSCCCWVNRSRSVTTFDEPLMCSEHRHWLEVSDYFAKWREINLIGVK